MTKIEYSNALKELFPGDSAKVRMNFALALWSEENGDTEKAEMYLAAAIAEEEKEK